MTSNAYITIVIVAGLALIGYLFAVTPETAPTQLPLILAGVGALVAVLNKQGDTDSRVEKSIAVSAENSQTLAAVSQQTGTALESVAQKTDTVVKMVDGQMTALMMKIDALTDKVTNLEKDKAATAVELTHAIDSEARIIAAVVAVAPMLSAAEIVPPPDEPRAGPGTHQ